MLASLESETASWPLIPEEPEDDLLARLLADRPVRPPPRRPDFRSSPFEGKRSVPGEPSPDRPGTPQRPRSCRRNTLTVLGERPPCMRGKVDLKKLLLAVVPCALAFAFPAGARLTVQRSAARHHSPLSSSPSRVFARRLRAGGWTPRRPAAFRTCLRSMLRSVHARPPDDPVPDGGAGSRSCEWRLLVAFLRPVPQREGRHCRPGTGWRLSVRFLLPARRCCLKPGNHL